MKLGFDDLVDFQQEGVAFLLDSPRELNYKNHRYLAFDPGLGKTPTACVAASMLKPKNGRLKALWIVPTGTNGSVKRQWAKELVTWGVCEESEIFIVPDRVTLTDANHIIVNPELLVTSPTLVNALMQMEFDLVLYDEAHGLKNLKAKITRLVLGGRGQGLISRGWSRWMLSGTPTPNNVMELYPAFRALAPECIEPYLSEQAYGTYFCGGYFDGREFKAKGLTNGLELATRSKCFIMRREVRDVHRELPPVIESDVWLDIGDLSVSEQNCPMPTLRRYIGLAKVPHVSEYLAATKSKRKRIVFAWHPEVIDAIVATLDRHAVSLHGQKSEAQRRFALDQFLSNPLCLDLVAQMNCVGTAYDGLQKVCHNIVFAENDWSYGGNCQQIGRVWRFGQEETTYVYNLVAQNTMDANGIIRSRWRKEDLITEFYNDLKEVNDMAILEDILEALQDIRDALEAQNAHDGVAQIANAATPGKPRTRRTKAQIEADKVAQSLTPTASGNNGQPIQSWQAPPLVQQPAQFASAPAAGAPGFQTSPAGPVAGAVGYQGQPMQQPAQPATPTLPPIPQAFGGAPQATQAPPTDIQPDVDGFPTLESLTALAVQVLGAKGGGDDAKSVIAQIVGQALGKPTASLKEVPAQLRPQVMQTLQQFGASPNGQLVASGM